MESWESSCVIHVTYLTVEIKFCCCDGEGGRASPLVSLGRTYLFTCGLQPSELNASS